MSSTRQNHNEQGNLPDRRTAVAFGRSLLAWYDRYKRDLPWRVEAGKPANPYAVLVSEAMLQQTQVTTVIDYFHRFMQTFPALKDLAQADESKVLRLWQGLGYYRRARNLHATAKMIVEQFDGRVPDTVEQLMKLPGIGRYTAGAIASIAYGTQAPVLDGNVMRVLARWLGEQREVDEPATNHDLWMVAEMLLSPDRPGDHNQAMMELGALVCTKANPNCAACPISKKCIAKRDKLTAELPRKRERRKPTAVTHHVVVIERRGKFLFQQRPDTGLWSRMWQMPTAEHFASDAEPQTLRKWIEETYRLKLGELNQSEAFFHQTTHRSITFRIYRATVEAGRLKPGGARWLSIEAAGKQLALANPQRHVIKLLKAGSEKFT